MPSMNDPQSVPTPQRTTWRALSFQHELANCISHGIGLLLAIAMLPVLLLSATKGGIHFSIGAAVFGATVVLLYLSSTLYHWLTHERAKHIFRLCDHSSIFLLIAGTYTPFALGVLRGPWGWTLLTIVWVLAVLGVATKVAFGVRYPWMSMTLYLLMGWLAVAAVKPILLNIPVPGILLILAGGIAYTGGLAFFASRRLRYGHFIWHLFVITGTTCHYFAVLWYAS